MMNNLAIVTARSGSKGLPDKNIKKINNIPLLAYSIIAAQKSNIFSEIMVSTDSRLYADISEQFGASVPFLRSTENSGDKSSSWDVVIEVLKKYKEQSKLFDTVCLLQPTSPLRTAEDITNGYKLLLDKNGDAVTAVCEVDHSPLWTMTLTEDVSLAEYRKKSKDVPRQNLQTYYRVNGALYIKKIDYSDGEITLLDDNEYALIMKKERSIDIDDELDFKMAEFLIQNNCCQN